ncbi:1126_t:CDS:2 [Diversispora eburnea]|uniref:1126_t:CDS:1 n=1 Tax=Diversispora eburnea TaxID=1213867 RepID=A0A9N9CIU2_9GLOM|nr:1126_t:CDS:2 [Diversispora eburnea]
MEFRKGVRYLEVTSIVNPKLQAQQQNGDRQRNKLSFDAAAWHYVHGPFESKVIPT